MIAEGLKSGFISRPKDDSFQQKGYYWILWYSADSKLDIKYLGAQYGAAKGEFEKETEGGKAEGFIIDQNWSYKMFSGVRSKSGQYLKAYKTMSQYVFKMKWCLGVIADETKAGFEMEYIKLEKI
jgi:hypothetical protein